MTPRMDSKCAGTMVSDRVASSKAVSRSAMGPEHSATVFCGVAWTAPELRELRWLLLLGSTG